MSDFCLHVAVEAPIRHGFDYLPSDSDLLPLPGTRVQVPFGRTNRLGIVLEHRKSSEGGFKLKRISKVLDDTPEITPEVLELLVWAAHYYQFPIGQVIETALPALLRRMKPVKFSGVTTWKVTDAGRQEDLAAHRRARIRSALLQYFQEHPEGMTTEQLRGEFPTSAAPLRALAESGLVEAEYGLPEPPPPVIPGDVGHNPRQRSAIKEFRNCLDSYSCSLLHGVTGSGKTEVYRAVIASVLERGGQVLVIVPEIGLVPQLRDRLARDQTTRIVESHSECTPRERYLAWLLAQEGQADIVVGTRSAVFLPFQNLQLIVIDEEHDASLKQQEGFRYHARDVAIYRAHRADIPVILGTATPSIETWRNVLDKKYRHIRLPNRAGPSRLPSTEIIDLMRNPATEGLSEPLMEALRETMDRGEQALLFLNRRGFAPALLAPQSQEPQQCPACDVCLTYHLDLRRLQCHHCGFSKSVGSLIEQGATLLGEGTQRVEERLRDEFPGCPILRLDRDNIRRRGELEATLEQTRRGEWRIVIGTQMLSKGHDFPNVTLVGIINSDRQLFSPRIRAPEHLAQILVQVSGRAGRRMKAGRVMLQTCLPRHPMLRQLLEDDYETWLGKLREDRRRLNLPPYCRWALFQARHNKDYDKAEAFLNSLAEQIKDAPGISLMGPAPALMPRMAGEWRAQLLLRSRSRQALERCLDACLDGLGPTRGMQWWLDVDPLDIA